MTSDHFRCDEVCPSEAVYAIDWVYNDREDDIKTQALCQYHLDCLRICSNVDISKIEEF